jgi:hypothetical protein
MMPETTVRHPWYISIDPFSETLVYVGGPLRAPTHSKSEDGGGDFGHSSEIQNSDILADLLSGTTKELSVVHYGGEVMDS